MNPLCIRRIALALLASHVLLAPASAQPAPVPMPPKLEPLEEGDLPPADIPEEPPRRIDEIRNKGGKVSEVTVSKGANTYVLRPNDQAGSALPGDAQASTLRGAQWQIFQFDLRRPQQQQNQQPDQQNGQGAPAGNQAPVPAPPAPPRP